LQNEPWSSFRDSTPQPAAKPILHEWIADLLKLQGPGPRPPHPPQPRWRSRAVWTRA